MYSTGMNKSIIIVGLGNVGKKYDGTRHNIGFAAVDALAKSQEFDPWIDKKDLKCHITSQTIGSTRVMLCKPTTFMNLSGEAVQALAHFYKVPVDHIIAVHDELDIPFGQIRMRMGGSSAGHNGIKSLTQHLGEGYGRVRIGVQAETPMDAADFVLTSFSKEELTEMDPLIKESIAILTEYIHSGSLLAETRGFIF